jgi:hypothetical protein
MYFYRNIIIDDVRVERILFLNRVLESLIFSKDTIYLDTVFNNIGSSTYTLKVYNKSNKDITHSKYSTRKRNSSQNTE